METHFHGESRPVPIPTPLEKLAHHPVDQGCVWMRAEEVLSRIKTGLIHKAPVMKAAISPTPMPVGRIKGIGSTRELDQALHPLDDGDWMIEVTMLEKDKKAEYRPVRLAEDPDAH